MILRSPASCPKPHIFLGNISLVTSTPAVGSKKYRNAWVVGSVTSDLLTCDDGTVSACKPFLNFQSVIRADVGTGRPCKTGLLARRVGTARAGENVEHHTSKHRIGGAASEI